MDKNNLKQQIEDEEMRENYFIKAEMLNGRLAMIGFAIGIVTQVITGYTIVDQVKYMVGLSG